jgi:electron transport complex protein RnfG
MRDVIKIGIRLTIITLIAAALLGVTNVVTEPTILAQKEASEMEAKLSVLSQADDFVSANVSNTYLEGNGFARIIEVYQGTKAGEPVGYTFKIAAKGFGGDLTIVMGIQNGEKPVIEGVKILAHQETPGLGAKAGEAQFIDQYQQKGNEPLMVSKIKTDQANAIQAITGATITSKAVTDGINYALECYKSIAIE